ncbi:hypothetical protein SAMN04488038_107150 [Solimonas aquatica]|uniref:Uncharacterized protein n=1 Tax=Solimonas aquatica TaxID=489703 RepID=A0A1H9GP40_9GAMM|nr:hypothetical protein [Solimonas aquatica]SEQ51803.1 hypothetical protein SAMN04488038_107150 [Solimonas aquatica]
MRFRSPFFFSLLLLAALHGRPVCAEPASPPADAPPAPVYLIPEQDARRAVVAQTRAREEEREAVQTRIQGTLGAMRHMGWVTLSALAMLFGSAVLGVVLALGRNLYQKRRGT